MYDRILDSRDIKRDNDSKYILSYGGGVNSTALIIYIVNNKMPLDHVVFSDTGDEMPETYQYLKVMGKYLKRRNINFEIVMNRRNESLSSTCSRRKVIPSQVWRWCTRDFKVTPIHAFYRKFKTHIYQYMGIDYGEVHRMKPAKVEYITNLYPLIDNKINRDGCIELIKNARLPTPEKSGCYFCPYNSLERWSELHKKHPELFNKSMSIEESGKHFKTQRLAPKGYSLRGIDEMIKQKKSLPMIKNDSPCGSECMI